MKLFNLHRVRLVWKNQIQSTACACLQEGVGGVVYGVPASSRTLGYDVWGACFQEGVGVLYMGCLPPGGRWGVMHGFYLLPGHRHGF